MSRRLAAVLVALLLAAMPPAAAAQGAGWCPARERLVILGDSGSTGYGSPDYPAGATTYMPTAHGWASIVSRNLAAEPAWRTATTVIAHGGAQAEDFLSGGRWPDTVGAVDRIREIRPTMVMIMLGGNEFYIDKDPTLFAAEYGRLVTAVKTAAPDATLVFVAEWELGARMSGTAVHTWSQYVAKIRDAAITHGGGMIDLRQYLGKPGTPAASGLYMADDIHPNQYGQRVLGAALWSFFVWSC